MIKVKDLKVNYYDMILVGWTHFIPEYDSENSGYKFPDVFSELTVSETKPRGFNFDDKIFFFKNSYINYKNNFWNSNEIDSD